MSEIKTHTETLRTANVQTHLSLNAHPRDKNITFDEPTHIYTIAGYNGPVTSVTTFLREYWDEFEPEKAIEMILNNKKYNTDPSYKYYKKSKEDILLGWSSSGKDASDAGTTMHLCIEMFMNHLPFENNSKEFSYFLNYARDYDAARLIYRTEWMIYSTEYGIAGSMDAILKNDDGTFTIVDWKRCKDVDTSAFRNKKCKKPLNHFDDCKYVHYAMQLNTYRFILENFYDMKISEMYLVICHPDNDNYIKLNIPRLEKETQVVFDIRKKLLTL